MKIFRLIVAALICMVSFAACSKEDIKANAGSMSAMVNGSAFTTSNCNESSSGGAWYVIKGTNTSNEVISIYIKSSNISANTTYDFDTTQLNHYATYEDVIKTGKAATGSVTIKSLNAGVNVSGTFHFNCTNGTTVTDGVFTALF